VPRLHLRNSATRLRAGEIALAGALLFEIRVASSHVLSGADRSFCCAKNFGIEFKMTSSSKELAIERNGAALHVTLTRPTRSNALSATLVEALLDVLQAAEADGTALVTFRGEGDNFCSGFDLGNLDEQSDGDLLLKLVRIEHLLQRVAYAPFVTLALVQGKVIGAGCDLFCACSERVAAPDTVFRMPGWRFGIALGTRRLVQRVGADTARSVLASSRMFAVDEALRMGLVTSLVKTEQWRDIVTSASERASLLEPVSRSMLLSLTALDTRAADLAALVESASRPGLKNRIQQYRLAERAILDRK
jgi:enoyl-CoA hydratase